MLVEKVSKSSFISPRSIHKLTSYEEFMVYSKIKIASKEGNLKKRKKSLSQSIITNFFCNFFSILIHWLVILLVYKY